MTIIGLVFGRLTVEGLDRRAGRIVAVCKCECGAEKIASVHDIRTGKTKSCGCLRREVTARRSTRHGQARVSGRTPAYRIWKAMKRRCFSMSDGSYANYGGRGITVCERWLSFESFALDMGEPPPGATIDRIDNDGIYEPGNCRWASRKQQNRNTRKNSVVECDGYRACISEWAEITGVKPGTIWARLRAGWPVEKSLFHRPGLR